MASKKLEEAEPALIAAKQAVNSINKSDLDTIRSYPNPPPLVKLTLEAVVCILEKKYRNDWSWNEVKAIVK